MAEQREEQSTSLFEIKEPSAEYMRNKEIPTFFGQQMLRGKIFDIDGSHLEPNIPILTGKYGLAMLQLGS